MDAAYEPVSSRNLEHPLTLEPLSVDPASLAQHPFQLPLLDGRQDPSRTDATEEQIEPAETAWTPLMLRRWVVSLFAGVFLALVVGLEVALKVSTDRQGFGPINPSLHYLWTYGPTAALTVIAAFWTQVDYRSRLMQPWRELANPPQTVDNTLFLDYVSPDPITVFIRSVRKRHWPVTAGLTGSLFLKILMIISTGLFSLQSSSPREDSLFTITHQFEMSGFNSSAVDDVAALVYAGVHSNNITYPSGTNASCAVEMFNLTEQSSFSAYNLTAQVRSLTTNLICEPASVGDLKTLNSTSTNSYEYQVSVGIESESCVIPEFQGLFADYAIGDVWVGTVFNATCDAQDIDNAEDQGRLVILNFLLKVDAILTSNGSTEGNHTSAGTAYLSGSAVNGTALVCQPQLTMQRSDVTIDQSGSLIHASEGENLLVPSNISAMDVTNAVLTSISQLNVHGILPYQHFTGFFAWILSSQSSTDAADLSNTDLQAKGAQMIFEGVASQISKRYFLDSNPEEAHGNLQGTMESVQQRLFVKLLSMRLMESALCILALVSLLLVFGSRRGSTPQDPASVARIVSFVSKSPAAINALSPTGSWLIKDLPLKLQREYSTDFKVILDGYRNPHPIFMIEGEGGKDVDDLVWPDENAQYWQPITTRWPSRFALPMVPLAIIIVLEVLLRKSQNYAGVAYVRSDKWTQLSSSYLPALTMVLTKLFFSASDFNIVSLIHALWTSLRNGRIAVGASTFAAILASFLTIAVSGLYIIKEIPHDNSISFTRLDQFVNPFAMHVSDDGIIPQFDIVPNFTSSLTARLVLYEQMNDPMGTKQDYVYPNFTIPQDTSLDLNASFVSISVAVQRGALSCELVPYDSVELDYSYSDANLSLSPGVEVFWSNPKVNWTACDANIFKNATTAYYWLDTGDGVFAEQMSYFDVSSEEDNCPASWGVFGNWSDRRATELNIINCWPSIQETQADISFALPGWTIQSMSVNDNSTKNVSTSMDTYLAFDYWVVSSIYDSYVTEKEQIDDVFTAFIRDQTTKALDTSLLQRHNWDKLRTNIEHRYSLAFAQILNLQGRNTSQAAQSTVSGTATSYSRYRLTQDVASTRVLQGLLIGMMLCAIICLFTVRLHDVVPKNPSSIAAQISLVAGSSMMEKLPPGAQWMDDKEFNALFDSERYSMGWRTDANGDRKFTIDVADGVWEE
ncbi:hypothetical protein K491DRAFT_723600 [Lophiostoma macrostomum CBS 122681]|uniref:Uncharacterized protein n=1 Tax=Lophiostoma macrostomum CBS 122681 TaxID=1314788 RepID=A0A6A6SM65_9PLEO|nr:hypothetical protein K491DRAFT_723600 [Lophiostoma macrostomum CBS 122681]